MVKTITIRNEVYEKLSSAKNREESFSEFLERLVENSNPIEVLKKLRGSVELPEKGKMLRELAEKRAERRA